MKQIILELRETPRLMDIEILFESKSHLKNLTIGDVWYDILNSVYKLEEGLLDWGKEMYKKAKQTLGSVGDWVVKKAEKLKSLVNYEKIKAAVLKVAGTVGDTLMEIIDAADKFRKEHPYLTTMLLGFVAAFLTVAFPGVGLLAVPIINGVFGAKNTLGLVEKMLGLVRRYLPESAITDKLTTAIDKLKDFQASPEERDERGPKEKAMILAELIICGYIVTSAKKFDNEQKIQDIINTVNKNILEIVTDVKSGKSTVESEMAWLDKHYKTKASGLIDKAIQKFFTKYAKPQQAAPAPVAGA